MDKLEDTKVWLIDDVREWREVRTEAANEGREIHVGGLHELTVEKGSELQPDDPNRKMKGRVFS